MLNFKKEKKAILSLIFSYTPTAKS